jgi:hypothetical protein
LRRVSPSRAASEASADRSSRTSRFLTVRELLDGRRIATHIPGKSTPRSRKPRGPGGDPDHTGASLQVGLCNRAHNCDTHGAV